MPGCAPRKGVWTALRENIAPNVLAALANSAEAYRRIAAQKHF